MRVTINGKDETIEDGITVAAYLQHAGLGATPCAVEINKRLIPKREHENATIEEGDTIEVVTLVGGG